MVRAIFLAVIGFALALIGPWPRYDDARAFLAVMAFVFALFAMRSDYAPAKPPLSRADQLRADILNPEKEMTTQQLHDRMAELRQLEAANYPALADDDIRITFTTSAGVVSRKDRDAVLDMAKRIENDTGRAVHVLFNGSVET